MIVYYYDAEERIKFLVVYWNYEKISQEKHDETLSLPQGKLLISYVMYHCQTLKKKANSNEFYYR